MTYLPYLNQKGSLHLLIVMLLVLLILGGGAYYLFMENDKTTPRYTPSSDPFINTE